MSSDDGQSKYYVRIRGKVLGPYTIKQLSTLRTRGQISQSNEISTDGTNWESAARLHEVFGTALGAGGLARNESSDSFEIAKQEPDTNSDSAKGQWYYSLDGKQLGPVPKSDLVQMLGVGALKPQDLIWTEGMDQWQPVADSIEFANVLPKASRKSSQSRAKEKDDSDHTPSHFLDHLLNKIRNGFDEASIRSLEAIPIEIGRWAVYVAMLLTLILSIFEGTKLHSPMMSLTGIASVLTLFAWQFAAIKVLRAINSSMRTKPQRMSSTALLDSVAVFFFMFGIAFLIAMAAYSIEFKEHVVLLIGMAVFVLFLQMTFMLLNPIALAITIDRRASAAEEALAIVAFFFMLPVRFALPLFAAGTLIGDVGMIVMFCMMIGAKETNMEFFQNLGWAHRFLGVVQLAAAMPIIAYLFYVLASLLIGLVQAILVIPDKLDGLADKLASEPTANATSETS